MSNKINIERLYLRWLLDMVCCDARQVATYLRLFTRLHETEFIVILELDNNRASDGLALRRRFEKAVNDTLSTDAPCSVLEMMVALSVRCEEQIMANENIGNRSGTIFWMMIQNMKLDICTDLKYDEQFVDTKIRRLLYREYYPDGTGGPFLVPNPRKDLREVELWYQMCWSISRYFDDL